MNLESNRPALEKRLFRSVAVEHAIRKTSTVIGDPELAWLFGNCLPNTLDTTVYHGEVDGLPDTFIITGDIPAMWLRDSTAQIWPYLRFCKEDPALSRMIAGLIHRQSRCVLLDAYANAFYRNQETGEWKNDRTDMRPGVHERKWELDSLAYFMRLSAGYWKATGDTAPFNQKWVAALGRVLDTLEAQKMGEGYSFQRLAMVSSETLALNGKGAPSRACGLVRSAFRPSDDACQLPFLIPANALAAVALDAVAELCTQALGNSSLAQRAKQMSQGIRAAIAAYGIVAHPSGTRMYAYEVDGFGGQIVMDDSNVPSLVALPYLGFCDKNDALYLQTRQLMLSAANPYFFQGTAAAGIGGPHVGLDFIWPIAITMQAMTAQDDAEILQCLKVLKQTHAGTGFMHESFHKDNPEKFTRPWFGWANSLFGELILELCQNRPHLLSFVK
ncbi:MAG: glycoside hydrolase family 125 protein [Verrucomicrobiota bacterium]|nr:glycoside hydrolase family 125 protein [Verrucomicrobiota bacterium]